MFVGLQLEAPQGWAVWLPATAITSVAIAATR